MSHSNGKTNWLDSRVALIMGWGSGLLLVAAPLYTPLSVLLASHFAHFDLWRIGKELLLFVFCLKAVSSRRVWSAGRELWGSKLIRLMALYIGWTLIMAVYGLITHNVVKNATIYGTLINTRLFAFCIFVMLALSLQKNHKVLDGWRYLVLIPASLVVAFGLIQLILPNDFLSHFGYGSNTILPYQNVDDNTGLVRIQSFLRGPNPLGAYLVLVLALVASLWNKRRKWQYMALLSGGLAVLYFTYSRSAWVASFLVLGLVAAWRLPKKWRSWVLIGATALLAVVLLAVVMFRNQPKVQDVFFHTSSQSTSVTSSNNQRANALTSSIKDVIKHPLGRGVGSAGPASLRNTGHPARLSENYFIQIAQESGWIGLGLFIAICFGVAKRFWNQRRQPLPMALLAALIGLTFVNLVSHAWTDDALAYTFWGLTAIALMTTKRTIRTNYEQSPSEPTEPT